MFFSSKIEEKLLKYIENIIFFVLLQTESAYKKCLREE